MLLVWLRSSSAPCGTTYSSVFNMQGRCAVGSTAREPETELGADGQNRLCVVSSRMQREQCFFSTFPCGHGIMEYMGRDLKAHLKPWTGTSSTRGGCFKPRPAWP